MAFTPVSPAQTFSGESLEAEAKLGPERAASLTQSGACPPLGTAWHGEKLSGAPQSVCGPVTPLFRAAGLGACVCEQGASGRSGVCPASSVGAQRPFMGEHVEFHIHASSGTKSSARPNFLIVKNELHSLQRAPAFPELFWLHEKGFEEFFERRDCKTVSSWSRERCRSMRHGKEHLSEGLERDLSHPETSEAGQGQPPK